jgi:hypothetical protein
MKKLYLIFSILLFIILSHSIRAETIIDSVYSVPELDGNMCYTPTGQFYSLNSTTYAMYVGDIGDGAGPPPNSCKRSFVSFELPEIPEGYEIDSVFIRLYQFDSHGVSPGPIYYDFPYWDIAGGDTVQCIMSHIDYGFELDAGDWAKGDVGNPYTYNHNIGMITDSGEDGYRYLDVTSSVLLDYSLGRTINQYRISFEIDTDWDGLTDKLAFTTSEFYDTGKPQIKLYLSNDVGVENNLLVNNLIIHCYPNPFNPTTTINYQIHKNSNILLQILNIKGQLIETIVNEIQDAGSHSVTWDASNHSSSIYFYKIKTGTQTATGKCLLLK